MKLSDRTITHRESEVEPYHSKLAYTNNKIIKNNNGIQTDNK